MAKKKTPSEQQILNKFQTITDQTNPKPKIVRNKNKYSQPYSKLVIQNKAYVIEVYPYLHDLLMP